MNTINAAVPFPEVIPAYITEHPEMLRVNADALAGSCRTHKPQDQIAAGAKIIVARDYIKRGYSVIPLKRDKKPAIPWKEYQKRNATESELYNWFVINDYNIGIVTGAISGLTVVDFDTLAAMEISKKKGSPKGPVVRTSKGAHIYCQYEEGHRNFQKRADLPGIDLRAEGGYVVAPPSIHSTGHVYKWVDGRGLDDIEPGKAPDWLFAKSAQDKTPITDLYTATTGSRNESLARLSGVWLYQNKGIDLTGLIEMGLAWSNGLHSPLPPDEVERTCKSIFNRNQSGKSLTTEQWPEPSPLPEGLPTVDCLEPDMIPASIRGWLMDIADRMQIPPDFSAAAAVVALGSIIGRGCGIYPKRRDDWLVVPNIWGGVIGRPSLMKTPAVTEAQRHLSRLEVEAREEYLAAEHNSEIDKEITKITKAAIAEEIKKAVKAKKEQDVQTAREKLAGVQNCEPVRQRFQTQDGTTEKIGELLNQNPRGLLINRDELIGWFRSLDRDGREGDRAFYLEAWNGNRSFTYDRIARGTLDIPALCLSVFGAITPGPLSSYVYHANRGGNGDDGLLQRFQVMVWPDAPTEWKNIDRFPDSVEKNRAWQIYKTLSGPIPCAVKEEGADIPALRFTPAGQDIFDTWRNELESRLRSDHGLPPSMESHLTKYRKLMPTLALIFHLVDVVDGKTTGAVSDVSAVLAVRWCKYLESHAGRIYGAATMPGMESAKEIIKHIRRGTVQDGVTVRELWRHGWSRLSTSDEAKQGLSVLQDYDWLTIEKTETGGRSSEIIRINPCIKL